MAEIITKIKETLGTALVLFITILWAFSGFIGALISAFRSDLVGVVCSIFIPGYGAVYTVMELLVWIFKL
jgi:hypothetical protein